MNLNAIVLRTRDGLMVLCCAMGALLAFFFILALAVHPPAESPQPRPTTILLPREPAVLVLLSPVDDDQIDTATLAGLHKAGMLAYRAAVEERLELVAKGRTE